MTSQIRLSCLLLALAVYPLPVYAQNADNAQAMQRIDHLEHDLMLLQRQVSRDGGNGDGGALTGPPPADSASLEVRLSNIEEEMRNIRGKYEENEFKVRKLSDTVEKLQHDVDYRFNALGNAPAAASTPAAIAAPVGTPAPESDKDDKIDKADKADKTDKKDVKPLLGNPPAAAAAPAPGEPTTAGDGLLHTPDDTAKDKTDFSSPREHYNYAFRLLNQTQYPEAATAFDTFTKKYPKDPLVGNAFYWEGETYYIRRDYVNAADHFRQGFEALPDGPKAADNLLKLAMSLNALTRDKEACVVLQQIVTKFKKSSTAVTEKADQEQKRIGCK